MVISEPVNPCSLKCTIKAEKGTALKIRVFTQNMAIHVIVHVCCVAKAQKHTAQEQLTGRMGETPVKKARNGSIYFRPTASITQALQPPWSMLH